MALPLLLMTSMPFSWNFMGPLCTYESGSDPGSALFRLRNYFSFLVEIPGSGEFCNISK